MEKEELKSNHPVQIAEEIKENGLKMEGPVVNMQPQPQPQPIDLNQLTNNQLKIFVFDVQEEINHKQQGIKVALDIIANRRQQRVAEDALPPQTNSNGTR